MSTAASLVALKLNDKAIKFGKLKRSKKARFQIALFNDIFLKLRIMYRLNVLSLNLEAERV